MLTPVNNIQEYFDTLSNRFVSSSAKGIHAIFQYKMTGKGGGVWHTIVNDGSLDIFKGRHPAPSVKLKMPAKKYVKMVNGELDGRQAFAKHQLKISGSMDLALKMQRIFPQNKISHAIEASKIDPQVSIEGSNVDRMRNYCERMTRGDFSALDDLASPDWVTHASPSPILKAFADVTCARDGERVFFEQLTKAFSHREFNFNFIQAIDDNHVVINYTIFGVHDGESFFDVPPSNQEEKINGTAILRFENGKIIEHWGGPTCCTCTGYVCLRSNFS